MSWVLKRTVSIYVPCLAVGGCLASSSACPSLMRSMFIQTSSVPLSIRRTLMLEFSSSPTNCLQGNKVKPVLSGHSKRRQNGFQGQSSLNAGQMYCRMLQGEHSAILSTFIKLSFVIKIFVLSNYEWPLKTGFNVF